MHIAMSIDCLYYYVSKISNGMKVCQICEKGSVMGGTRRKLRGNYNPVNWSRKYPNLQKTRTLEGKRILACANCIKKMNKDGK